MTRALPLAMLLMAVGQNVRQWLVPAITSTGSYDFWLPASNSEGPARLTSQSPLQYQVSRFQMRLSRDEVLSFRRDRPIHFVSLRIVPYWDVYLVNKRFF